MFPEIQSGMLKINYFELEKRQAFSGNTLIQGELFRNLRLQK